MTSRNMHMAGLRSKRTTSFMDDKVLEGDLVKEAMELLENTWDPLCDGAWWRRASAWEFWWASVVFREELIFNKGVSGSVKWLRMQWELFTSFFSSTLVSVELSLSLYDSLHFLHFRWSEEYPDSSQIDTLSPDLSPNTRPRYSVLYYTASKLRMNETKPTIYSSISSFHDS